VNTYRSTDGATRKIASPPAAINRRPNHRAPVEPFRPQRLGQRFSAHAIADLVARYERGESATALTGQQGIASSALLRLLRRQGVSIRGQRVTPELIITLRSDYEEI